MSNVGIPVLAQCEVRKLQEQEAGFVLPATFLVSRKIVTGNFDRPSTIHYFYNSASETNGFPEFFGLWGFAALNDVLWRVKTGALAVMTFRGKSAADAEGRTPWLCDVQILKNDTINAAKYQELKDAVADLRQYIAAQDNMIFDAAPSLPATDWDELPF